MDVVSFAKAIQNYSKELRDNHVDMFANGISLPGLAKKILSRYMYKGSMYYLNDMEIINIVKKSEIGGQSIIFTRENSKDHPYIVGYDSNSLYLWCLGEGQYVGKPSLYVNPGIPNFLIRKSTDFTYNCTSHTFQSYMLMIERKKKATSSKVQSQAEEDYFDYIQKEVYTENTILRNYKIVFTKYEQEIMKELYTINDIGIEPPKCIFVDGYLKGEGRVFEFQGCYYHACERCNKYEYATFNRWDRATKKMVVMNALQIRKIDKIRKTFLEKSRNLKVTLITECKIREHYRNNVCGYKDFVDEKRSYEDKMKFYSDTGSEYVPTEYVKDMLVAGQINGIVVCDIHCPEHLKKHFEDFAPIIKHANIKYEDIGEYMKDLADDLKIVFPKEGRKSVIDSYFGKNIALIDEYFVWLVKKGFIVTEIYAFVRFKKEAIFSRFATNITKLRIAGDSDKSSEMKAYTAKLIGNSAFGSCITNKEKQLNVEFCLEKPDVIEKTTLSSSSMINFEKYEVITPEVVEIELKKKRIILDQVRQIAAVIFGRAKLHILRFYYDFIKVILKPENYELMLTDTDSIYLSLKYRNFEDNIDPAKMDYYERHKDEFFIGKTSIFGKRQPNRFKVECTGTNLIALCAKSYIVAELDSNNIKFSCKGVQKNEIIREGKRRKPENIQEGVLDVYRATLEDPLKDTFGINRGIRSTNTVLTTYEQKKKMTSAFYCKRRILDDGIHTVPLDI